MKEHFQEKLALITGGSSGIGKALAKSLGELGCSTCILARNQERLESAKEEISKVASNGAFIDVIKADVTEEDQISRNFSELVAKRGTPDFLFNCAGKAEPSYIQDYRINDFRRAMELDYLGTVIPSMELLPRFMERGSGHIINISSVGGFLGIIGYGTYTPAKFAVVGFSEVLRHEMKPHGIQVSVVFPPDVETPGFSKENKVKPEECKIISETGKLMQPEDVARKIIKGVKKGNFLILPGSSGYIHKLKGIWPSLVYKFIDDDLKKARKKIGKK